MNSRTRALLGLTAALSLSLPVAAGVAAAGAQTIQANLGAAPPPPPPPPPPGDCTAPAWSASQVYPGGAQVSHAGHEWRAKWWTQGEEPGTTGQWGVWEDLGGC
jgi:chitinase